MMERKTPLYDRHVALGARMTPYAGFLMPLQYGEGILAEHLAVRREAGLFDVSHMGEVVLTGHGVTDTLGRLCTNRMNDLPIGRARYSPLCLPSGGTVDDVLVYHLDKHRYMIVLNAANHDKDIEWIRTHLAPQTEMADLTADIGLIALQGPRAAEIMSSLCPADKIPAKRYAFTEQAPVKDLPCLLSRTGYTGEDGFELYASPADLPLLWDHLVAAGAAPCGLGARDTLRLEAGMPLYGHELSEEITPLEAGLSAFVKTEDRDFIGREALLAAPTRRLVGLELLDRGVPREGYEILALGRRVGVITSGSYSAYLKKAVAMALIEAGLDLGEEPVRVDMRGREVPARIVPLPFYKRGK